METVLRPVRTSPGVPYVSEKDVHRTSTSFWNYHRSRNVSSGPGKGCQKSVCHYTLPDHGGECKTFIALQTGYFM